MSYIDTNKVTVEYRNGVCKESPVYNRKYTVTHCDETAELFVTIGMEYANDKYSEIRDEVLFTFLWCGNCVIGKGIVQLDVPGRNYNREIRREIFLREMSKALQAIRYGDREFFEAHELIDQAEIYIEFVTDDCICNKEFCFGKMRDYRCKNTEF